MEFVDVTCPSCFQTFSVASPSMGELPAKLDYDCEICCRPMEIYFDESGYGQAQSLDDL